MKWIKIQDVRVGSTYLGYEEFISEDGTIGRQLWSDGFEEIYEIEK